MKGNSNSISPTKLKWIEEKKNLAEHTLVQTIGTVFHYKLNQHNITQNESNKEKDLVTVIFPLLYKSVLSRAES